MQFEFMGQAEDQELVDALLRRIGMGDRAVGDAIGVSQPTIWRLRKGKMRRPRRYIPALRDLAEGGATEDVEALIAQIRPLAQRSAQLRHVLGALIGVIQNE